MFQGNPGSPGLKGEGGDPGPQVKTLTGTNQISDLSSKSNSFNLNKLYVKICIYTVQYFERYY